MAHRTQITLTDAQYEALRRESARTGLSLAELVRRALSANSRAAGPRTARALDASFGCWSDRDLDGAEYVERLRPGLGERIPE
jgi:hypothetical protein